MGLILTKNLGEWVDGWMDRWVGGWMDGKAGLRIAYNNQKSLVTEWMGG